MKTTATAQEPTAYAVADASTGYLLDSRRPNKKVQIASITKIATALVVLDWIELSKRDQNTLIAIPPGALAFEPANALGFQPGDQISIRDLMYAALIQSSNIAAYTLADYVGRDLQRGFQSDGKPVDLFVGQMNALARKLKMENTKFLNPIGIDSMESPHSTARDLVFLSMEAMSRSSFRFIVSQRERRITIHGAAGQSERTLTNTNQLLGSHAIDGVKTGQSARAGECVVISAAKSPEAVQNPDGSFTVTPRRLIVVVLGSENRFNDATQLLNNGWNLYDEWAAQGRPLPK
ncbi:MAG: D-alanyl-D-alanine carboxypeptidase family protein [Chthoniobacteraceae bacterium]